MRIYDALTYHACVAQAQPDHYVALLHWDDEKGAPKRHTEDYCVEHVVLHVKCMRKDDHDYNAWITTYMPKIAVHVSETNPLPGHVPCHRCKLY